LLREPLAKGDKGVLDNPQAFAVSFVERDSHDFIVSQS
jgi:hypothetical protein